MTFFDRYGRIHDRPTNGSDPSSDNGLFYSAVYVKLGGSVTLDPAMFEECASQLKRHPDSVTNRPYNSMSRDEILGCEYLKPNSTRVLENNWMFTPPEFVIPKFSFIKLLVQAIHCIDPHTLKMKHSTTFWKEKYDQIYRFAFSTPISDRHTILKINGKYNLWWHLIHIIAHIKAPTKRSARQLYWFKTGKDIQGVIDYHPEGSPIRKLAMEKLK
jgi:hypothetical protein